MEHLIMYRYKLEGYSVVSTDNNSAFDVEIVVADTVYWMHTASIL